MSGCALLNRIPAAMTIQRHSLATLNPALLAVVLGLMLSGSAAGQGANASPGPAVVSPPGGAAPDDITRGFAAGVALPEIKTGVASGKFAVGEKLFSNRDYTVHEIPAFLKGAIFLQSDIEGVEFTALKPGVVIALTPVLKPGAASQEAALLAAGFVRVDSGEYQLFPGEINRVACYGKILQAGEKLVFGKWVIVVLPARTPINLPPQAVGEAPSAAGTPPVVEMEVLHNGIEFPRAGPAAASRPEDDLPMPVPYLLTPPAVIPIHLGRQLFVDDFLIASSTFRRTFHAPQKYPGNPVLKPETPLELQNGLSPSAAPFSDGVFYDPASSQLKMWYQAGWFDGTALAVSPDGFRWQRPVLGVVPGTNQVIPDAEDRRRDGGSVWLDHEAKDPAERYKMFLYTRYGRVGQALQSGNAHILTSPDGVHWDFRAKLEPSGADNTTFFYNPFRRKWVFAIKSENRGMRTRDYWECDDFVRDPKWGPRRPFFWLSSDGFDQPDPAIGDRPQLYKMDAVAYESLMVGMFQMHYGPTNGRAAAQGMPKTTDLQVGFSRDGFHWDRPNRSAFIAASRKNGSWDRGYVTAAGGGFVVTNDQLLFYYTAFRGNPKHLGGEFWNGMYANASTGLAFLRRDGFASMDAGPRREVLTTRPVLFDGGWLFVNVDAQGGELRVEVLDRSGRVLPQFSYDKCLPISGNFTRRAVMWMGGVSLAQFKGQPVRFRFHGTKVQLYSFWVSEHPTGESGGYLAAGRIGSPLIRDFKPNTNPTKP
jgi:hypothetical protein